MRDYLLFRLYGPLAAWGDIAVGEYRPSFAHPSKSAIMGLVAAALGLRREQEEGLRALAESFHFAVRVDAMGNLLRDYHTTQVPPSRKGVIHRTRRSELAFRDLNTILSSRDYRVDAVYTVALWGARETLPYNLDQLTEALRKPVFTLYLGRKSCPPSLPLQPMVFSSDTLRGAFDQANFQDAPFIDALISRIETGSVHWEGSEPSGFAEQHIITRRDNPVSYRRRQFAERREHYAGIAKGKEE
jgi:CRISPR system Cascade subunit CasD